MRQEPHAASLFEERKSISRQVATLALAAPEPQQREAQQQKLAILTERQEALERDLARESAVFRRQQAIMEMSPTVLQQALNAGTALVDLLEYTQLPPLPEGQNSPKDARRLMAFVVRGDRPIQRIDLGPVASITAAIDRWQQFDATSSSTAHQLRQRLWEPLAIHLDGVLTLLISPDGAVARFPWAALPGSHPGTYLLEDLAIAVVPVPQQYFAQHTVASVTSLSPQQTSSSLLLVGGVEYGGTPGTSGPGSRRGSVPPMAAPEPDNKWRNFEPLPYTGSEVAAIAQLFSTRFPQAQTVILRKSEATEGKFRTLAEQSRYLHVATHGFFTPPWLTSALVAASAPSDPTNLFHRTRVSGWHPGLLSGLALAGANTSPEADQDDGILTALEIAALDLRSMEVAVLAGCKTGLGRVAGGEGILGLQRAFQVAGTRNVVASLWDVDDQVTAALMGLFYYYLWDAQQPPMEALRNAQLFLLRHSEHISEVAGLLAQSTFRRAMPQLLKKASKASRVTRAKPQLWAAFVLSGSSR